jgi:hypothetical protein
LVILLDHIEQVQQTNLDANRQIRGTTYLGMNVARTFRVGSGAALGSIVAACFGFAEIQQGPLWEVPVAASGFFFIACVIATVLCAIAVWSYRGGPAVPKRKRKSWHWAGVLQPSVSGGERQALRTGSMSVIAILHQQG